MLSFIIRRKQKSPRSQNFGESEREASNYKKTFQKRSPFETFSCTYFIKKGYKFNENNE